MEMTVPRLNIWSWEWLKEQGLELQRKYREELQVVGIFLFSLSPVLGNALAFRDLYDRRRAQGLMFMVAAIFIAAGFRHLVPVVLARLKERGRHPVFLFFGVMTAVLAARALFAFLSSPQPVALVSWAEPVLLWTWFAILAICGVLRKTAPGDNTGAMVSKARLLNVFFGSVVAFLYYKSWTTGPDPGFVYMAYGGSTIVTGVCATIAAFSMLSISPRLSTLLLSTGLMYVIAMSTSRIVLVVGVVFLVLLNLRALILSRLRPSRSWIVPLLSGAIFFSTLIAPAALESRYFPYYVPRSAPPGVSPHFYREEYIRRWARLLRVFPFCQPYGRAHELKCFGVVVPSNEPGAESPGEVLYQQALKRDDRFAIYSRTWELILDRPLGYWPEPFSKYIGIDCDINVACSYPHNFFLEVGFNFGWFPLLALLLLLYSVATVVLRSILTSRSAVGVISSVSFAGIFMQMQISGNIFDTFPALVFAFLLIVAESTPSVACRP